MPEGLEYCAYRSSCAEVHAYAADNPPGPVQLKGPPLQKAIRCSQHLLNTGALATRKEDKNRVQTTMILHVVCTSTTCAQ
jgi:hypothetical protein